MLQTMYIFVTLFKFRNLNAVEKPHIKCVSISTSSLLLKNLLEHFICYLRYYNTWKMREKMTIKAIG